MVTLDLLCLCGFTPLLMYSYLEYLSAFTQRTPNRSPQIHSRCQDPWKDVLKHSGPREWLRPLFICADVYSNTTEHAMAPRLRGRWVQGLRLLLPTSAAPAMMPALSNTHPLVPIPLGQVCLRNQNFSDYIYKGVFKPQWGPWQHFIIKCRISEKHLYSP